MLGINTLAHYEHSQSTFVRIFITLGPVVSVIKSFSLSLTKGQDKLVSMPRTFYKASRECPWASLIFASKASSMQSGAPLRVLTPHLIANIKTRLTKLARHGHYSLFCPTVSGESLILLTPGVNVIKLFFFIADNKAK